MKKEFYRITYRERNCNLKSPFMHQCWSKEMLDNHIQYLLEQNMYDIKIYKVIETEELLQEVN